MRWPVRVASTPGARALFARSKTMVTLDFLNFDTKTKSTTPFLYRTMTAGCLSVLKLHTDRDSFLNIHLPSHSLVSLDNLEWYQASTTSSFHFPITRPLQTSLPTVVDSWRISNIHYLAIIAHLVVVSMSWAERPSVPILSSASAISQRKSLGTHHLVQCVPPKIDYLAKKDYIQSVTA
jgi:hypothetical protein